MEHHPILTDGGEVPPPHYGINNQGRGQNSVDHDWMVSSSRLDLSRIGVDTKHILAF